MPSRLELCNLALIKMNQEFIGSMDEDSVLAKRLNYVFDTVLRRVLSMEDWVWAKHTVQLNLKGRKSGDDRPNVGPVKVYELFDFEYCYELPENWARIVSIHDGDTMEQLKSKGYGDNQFSFVGSNYLHANVPSVVVKYIGFIEDEMSFPPAATELVVLKLMDWVTKKANDDLNYIGLIKREITDALADARAENVRMKDVMSTSYTDTAQKVNTRWG